MPFSNFTKLIFFRAESRLETNSVNAEKFLHRLYARLILQTCDGVRHDVGEVLTADEALFHVYSESKSKERLWNGLFSTALNL